MPARTDQLDIIIRRYNHPSEVPRDVVQELERDARTNIFLAHFKKVEADRSQVSPDQFWLFFYRSWRSQPDKRDLDFVVAVTNGPIRSYPIFIYTTRRAQDVTDSYLDRFMPSIVHALRSSVPVERVFSVFALDEVTRSFTAHWSAMNKIAVVNVPYYAAKFTVCDKSSLRPPKAAFDQNIVLREATRADLPQTSRATWGFAAESDPFVLSREDAWKEADYLTRLGQLWVLEYISSTGSQIACIVAVSRSSETVSAITKVYTMPDWRGNGFAGRLVHRVCEYYLNTLRKHLVVLYVAHENIAAAKVYHNVGFAETAAHSEYVENWLELGFDRTKVQLGHW